MSDLIFSLEQREGRDPHLLLGERFEEVVGIELDVEIQRIGARLIDVGEALLLGTRE